MNAEALRAVILNALHDIAPEAELAGIDPEKSFHDQIEIDSIDFLNLMLALETALGVHIAETDYPLLSSLNGCIAYLTPRVGGN